MPPAVLSNCSTSSLSSPFLGPVARQQRLPHDNAAILILTKGVDGLWHTFVEYRTKGFHVGKLRTPGGKPEVYDRSPRHTAARELSEETGIQREPSELIALGRSLCPNGCSSYYLHEFATFLRSGESIPAPWLQISIPQLMRSPDEVMPSVHRIITKAQHLLQ